MHARVCVCSLACVCVHPNTMMHSCADVCIVCIDGSCIDVSTSAVETEARLCGDKVGRPYHTIVIVVIVDSY